MNEYININKEIKVIALKLWGNKRYYSVFPKWAEAHIGVFPWQANRKQLDQLLIYLKEKEINKECSLHTGGRRKKHKKHSKDRLGKMGVSRAQWKTLRWNVIQRDGFRCAVCGEFLALNGELTVDHIIPISEGGATTLTNLQILCEKHHNKKTNNDLRRIRRNYK